MCIDRIELIEEKGERTDGDMEEVVEPEGIMEGEWSKVVMVRSTPAGP